MSFKAYNGQVTTNGTLRASTRLEHGNKTTVVHFKYPRLSHTNVLPGTSHYSSPFKPGNKHPPWDYRYV